MTLVVRDRMPVADYRQLIASGAITWPAGGKRKPTNGPKRETPEEDLHRECFAWVELHTPKHPILNYLMHVPNGGQRPHGEAGKLKAMGTRPGVPDFLLPRSRGRWRGLAIEFKSPTGPVRPEQRAWLLGLTEEGYLVSVCRSLPNFERLALAFLRDEPMPDCCEAAK